MPAANPVATEAKVFGYYDEDGYWCNTDSYERMEKIDDRVKYRAATDTEVTANTRCYDCRFYNWGLCRLVEGTIEANNVCGLFKALPMLYPQQMHDIIEKEPRIRLTVEQHKFTAGVAPEWIEYWPAPGRFNHPTYGEIVITEDRNQRIVDNFKNAVYPQSALPIDCDHNLAISGAVGFINDMRISDTGSIEAKVEWNSFGQKLIEEDRFRYFSPSIIPLWSHTVTGEQIPDVAIGGAICNNPYFTEPWLRPLTASLDGQLTAWEPNPTKAGDPPKSVRVFQLKPLPRREEPSVPSTNDPAKTVTTAEKPAPEAAQFSAAEIQAFREFQASGGLAGLATLKETVEAQGQTIVQLHNTARLTRFTDMINGVETFADGTTKRGPSWVGERDDHLRIMAHIADTKGEDSEEFKAHIRTARAAAAQSNKGVTFKELGSGYQPHDAGDDPEEVVANHIKKFQTENPQLTYGDAMKRVEREHPMDFAAYRQDTAVRVK